MPAQLAAVPRARHSLAFNQFTYDRRDPGARLVWVQTPPFGRALYDFESRRWSSVD